MEIQEHIAIGSKTTMKIGGTARWYCEAGTRKDIEQAYLFTKERNIPLIVLGAGSNTIFDEREIEALVIRIKADAMTADDSPVIIVESGKYLAVLINELAARGQDLSALTGIPGTIGGALFGNAGQGAGGIWLDSFLRSATVFIDGQWKELQREECHFRYRESLFKDLANDGHTVIIWSATFDIPPGEPAHIKAEIERLLQKRIETQPHLKTAGSCFKSLPDGTTAWKLIEAAGLRGLRIGGIEVSTKHANFLLNVERGTFRDVREITQNIRKAVPQIASIEMRLYEADGTIAA